MVLDWSRYAGEAVATGRDALPRDPARRVRHAFLREFVVLFTQRTSMDARERIPTGAGGAPRPYHFYAAYQRRLEL